MAMPQCETHLFEKCIHGPANQHPCWYEGFFFPQFCGFESFVIQKSLQTNFLKFTLRKRKLPRFSENFVSGTLPKFSTKFFFLLVQSLKSQILFKLFQNITNITCLD